MGLVGQAIMGSAGDLANGPSPTEGDFPRVLGCQNQCLPQLKAGRMSKRIRINGRTVWHRPVLDTAFAALSDDANDNDRAEDLMPQGGISSFLPTITHKSSLTPCAPTAAARARQ